MTRRDYFDLSYRGQAGRLRELARRALPRFGLPQSSPMTLCNHGENAVFRVRDRRGRSFALRIHRTHYQTFANVKSELEWLAALRRDTELVVPEPKRGRDGAFVQRVSHEGVPEERSVVLLKWVDGRFRHRSQNESFFRAVGHLTGRLHAHGKTWRKPVGFRRRAWNEAVLMGDVEGHGNPLIAPGLSKRDRDLFKAGMKRARIDMRTLGKGKAVWGLIHADLHAGNVMFRQGRAGAIDFDDCGAGWYGYDIAVAVIPVFDKQFKHRLEWFLEGYAEHLNPAVARLETIQLFSAVRALSMVGWIVNRASNPRLAAYIPRNIERARNVLKVYLK